MKKFGLLAITALSFIIVYSALANTSNKIKNFVLDGGNRGNIFFPHETHQKALGDCTKCHSLFPQKAGSINTLIKSGNLKKKQVMKHCRECHRAMSREGKKTGPTSCKKCHDKSLKK